MHQDFTERDNIAHHVMDALVETGKALHQVFNNLNHADIATEVIDLDLRMSTTNLQTAGIQNDHIFEQFIESFSNIKKNLVTSRILLTSFAKSTISRLTGLEQIINTTEQRPDKTIFGLKLATKQMINIINLNDDTLPEAEDYIEQVNDLLQTVDQLLQSMKHSLETHRISTIQSRQIDFQHIRSKRSATSITSLFSSLVGKSTVNMIGNKKKGILGGVSKIFFNCAVGPYFGKFAAIGSAVIGGVIGGTALSSYLADYLTGSRVEEIRQTMEEARKELVISETQLQKFISEGVAMDKSFQKLKKEKADKQRELEHQQNLLQQELFQNQQKAIQSAINSMEFIHKSFSDTTIKLRSKIIPLGDKKFKLEQLLQNLEKEDLDGMKLDNAVKANVVNMIHNVKNACDNFIFKRMHQEYRNID